MKVNFSLQEILECEVACLKILKHKVNYFTPYYFINYFWSNGIVFKVYILKTIIEVNDDDNSQEMTYY